MAKISSSEAPILRRRDPGFALNERGDTTLLFSLAVVVLSSLVILLSLALHHELKLLKLRKELFLCTKAAKGEVKLYLQFMGRTNWGIRNASRVNMVAFWIPGVSGSTETVKRTLKALQLTRLGSYLKTLHSLQKKGCPLDPRMMLTPFEVGTDGFSRDLEGSAKLRKREWSYYFITSPYALEVNVHATNLDGANPRIKFKTSEKAGKLSSLLSSRSRWPVLF